MYRASRMLQPKNSPYCYKIFRYVASYNFGDYFKFSVTCVNQTAVIFFSNAMKAFLTEVSNVPFDSTFETVPIQFCQLWTIFVAVGRRTYSCLVNMHIVALIIAKSLKNWDSLAQSRFEIFTN